MKALSSPLSLLIIVVTLLLSAASPSKKHELFTIKLPSAPRNPLDEKKYKGLDKELLLKYINFSDSNNIGNSSGGRMLNVRYPTFSAYEEGEPCEMRENALEATYRLRKLVSNQD